MRKVIPIGLSVSSIDKAQKEILEISERWEKVAKTVLNELAKRGYDKASVKFLKVIYAGDVGQIDISTEVTDKDVTIRAKGEKVLFIEFGAGIRYENEHMHDYGFHAGSYGKRGLSQKGWYYDGSLGDNPPQDTDVAMSPKLRDRGLIHTYGSPANMPMYETQKELEDELSEIVREAWNGK